MIDFRRSDDEAVACDQRGGTADGRRDLKNFRVEEDAGDIFPELEDGRSWSASDRRVCWVDGFGFADGHGKF